MKAYTCLYVEDEDFLRDEIARFLKRRVGRLIVAENGQDGLEKFNQFPIDIVITDLKMPIMDGIEMTKKIRELNSDIPIIITTALSDVELMQLSIEIGVDRYLLKPIEVGALTNALESIEKKIAKKNNEKRLANMNSEEAKLIEKKIETEIARILKSTSGKGPQKVTVFLRANLVEVVIVGSRTTLENTILSSDSNNRIADYIRETYYQQIKPDVEFAVKEITGYHAVWINQICEGKKDIDIFKLILDI